jgi:TrmH family RNA methyltransferase
VFRKYQCSLEKETNHVVLDGIQDKGNLGTILRSMVGFGFADLAIIKPAVDIFDPKVIKASMGALFSLRFSYFSTFSDYQKAFPRKYYPFMTDAAISLEQVAFEQPYSLIFGSESEGLNSTYKGIGQTVKIPQSDKIDSLNLSISVGVGLFTASLQK